MTISFEHNELMEVLASMENEAVNRIVAANVTGESRDSWMGKVFGAYDLCLQMGWIDNGELIRMVDEFMEWVSNVSNAEEVANHG